MIKPVNLRFKVIMIKCRIPVTKHHPSIRLHSGRNVLYLGSVFPRKGVFFRLYGQPEN